MTELEMRQLFNTLLNQNGYTTDDIDDSEKYQFLNTATLQLIDEKFNGIVQSNKVGFEQTNKRIDDLRTILKTSGDLVASAALTEIPNSKSVSFESDHYLLYKVFAHTTGTLDGITLNTWQPCIKIEHEKLDTVIQSAINKPIIEQPLYIIKDNKIVVIYDPDVTIDNVRVSYIKEPTDISNGVNSELPVHVHKEIVSRAVTLAIESMERLERIQTRVLEENKIQ